MLCLFKDKGFISSLLALESKTAQSCSSLGEFAFSKFILGDTAPRQVFFPKTEDKIPTLGKKKGGGGRHVYIHGHHYQITRPEFFSACLITQSKVSQTSAMTT